MPAKRVTPLSDAVDRKLYVAGMTRADFARGLHISYAQMGGGNWYLGG